MPRVQCVEPYFPSSVVSCARRTSNRSGRRASYRRRRDALRFRPGYLFRSVLICRTMFFLPLLHLLVVSLLQLLSLLLVLLLKLLPFGVVHILLRPFLMVLLLLLLKFLPFLVLLRKHLVLLLLIFLVHLRIPGVRGSRSFPWRKILG